jgi:hypothetical protein
MYTGTLDYSTNALKDRLYHAWMFTICGSVSSFLILYAADNTENILLLSWWQQPIVILGWIAMFTVIPFMIIPISLGAVIDLIFVIPFLFVYEKLKGKS